MASPQSWQFGKALTKDATQRYAQANLFTPDQLRNDPDVEWNSAGELQFSILQFSGYQGTIEIQLSLEGRKTEYSPEIYRIVSSFDVGEGGIVVIYCSIYLSNYVSVPDIICLRVDEQSFVAIVVEEADPIYPSEHFGSVHRSLTFPISRALENLIELGHVVRGFEYWKSLASET